MTPDNFFLDNALLTLSRLFAGGYGNLTRWINGLLAFIFLVDLLFLVIKIVMGMKDAREFGVKFLNYAVWTLAVLIFPYLMEFIKNTFTSIGLTAGSPNISGNPDYQSMYTGASGSAIPAVAPDKMPLPGTILFQGIKNGMPIYNAMNNTGFFDLGARFFYVICWLLMMISYVIMTIQYIVTYLEFSVLIGIGGIFMPFGLLQETRFLSEKFLGAATGHGVKIMLLNFIFSVSNVVLASLSRMLETSLAPDKILVCITVSFLFMVMAQNVPAMAVGILSGTPALNDGHLANTMRTIASASRAAQTVGRMAGFMGRGAVQGAVLGGGGALKAVSAGMAARSNFMQNAEAAGVPMKPGSGAMPAIRGGMASLAQSLGASAASGGGRLFNRMMLGKEAAQRNQMNKPGSLQNIGRALPYMASRWNAGQNGVHQPSAARTASTLKNMAPFNPKFPHDVHSPDNTLDVLRKFSAPQLVPDTNPDNSGSRDSAGDPAAGPEFNLGEKENAE